MDKIIEVYIAGVCSKAFVYKGKCFIPKQLKVSPLLTRGYTCPSACGACCGSFSLDFLPSEAGTFEAAPRSIEIDGRIVTLNSDRQSDVNERWCRNLERKTGRCQVYNERPMACDFELLRFLVYESSVLLIQKQYGRAWAMERLDGERGASCEMLPPDPKSVSEVVRKLKRLESWGNFLGIPTRIPLIYPWIESGSRNTLTIEA